MCNRVGNTGVDELIETQTKACQKGQCWPGGQLPTTGGNRDVSTRQHTITPDVRGLNAVLQILDSSWPAAEEALGCLC